jgi:hypothetical protein
LVDLDPIRSSEILTDKVLYVIKRHLSHGMWFSF